ncbi:MAG: response regulator [Roseofilum sp. SID2]|uniref:ATP-binding protein n=1 Tax=unclassified Roseofilum TaxID=2620099 RepID=UPI001B1B5CD1|nr:MULTISPECIES: ATP-binding protein [unclassified Roseofilum]MBP0023507.1 response regulator [Roseofilum sp. SID2]MBP0037649.1 response regulator [Roseofilum sp. SID1]
MMTDVTSKHYIQSLMSSLILIVEEDPPFAKELSLSIDPPLAGAIVSHQYVTQTVREIAEITTEQPHLIVVDVNSSNLQPLTEAIAYRQKCQTYPPAILAISECHQPDFISQILELGADDYLPKPLHPELLNKRITSLLGISHPQDRCFIDPYLNQALNHLQALNELKSRIITTISHEYRTPLTTIGLSIGMLERYRDKWDREKQNKHFDRIHKAINHMTSLLEDILFIKDADFGLLEFNPTLVDVIPLFEQAIARMQAIAGSQYSLEFLPQDSVTSWMLDSSLLEQILVHLLSNAIKYSPQGGTVSVRVRCLNNTMEFQIQDRGIGIPESEKQHLFDSFHRGSNIGNIGGTGLGLSIVKKSVDLHNGTIHIDSQVNQGTTFTITLPARP